VAAIDALTESSTMIDLLRRRAEQEGELVGYTVVVDGERDEVSLTFAELDRRARAIGSRLQVLGQAGDPVLVLCPLGLPYFAAMFGCFYGGRIAVPDYAADVKGHADRLRDLVKASGARVGVTTRDVLPQLLEIPELRSLQWVTADEVPDEAADFWREPSVDPDAVALLVYTSGSVSAPKGVMLSHKNLLYATDAGMRIPAHRERHRLVVASPPQYVASIVPGIIYPAFSGIPVTYLPPEALSARPARWLETVSRTRATISQAVNFLFDLSVQSIPPDARDALDLSCVHRIWNRGESVRADTIARFEAYFAPCGLRPDTVRPVYAMSEAPSITIAARKAPPAIRTFDRARLQEGEVVELPGEAEGGQPIVGQGVPAHDQRVEIVDPQTLARARPGRVGEIWISGPLVARGYWNRPDETAGAFEAYLADSGEGPFLRTGDLGFLYEDELFITGRLKEMIIIRGRNLYPADLEASLQDAHPALQSHAAAAFAVDVGEQERLAIVHECPLTPGNPSPPAPLPQGARGDVGTDHLPLSDTWERRVPSGWGGEGLPDIISAIRRTVLGRHGVQVHRVALVGPGAIPRVGHGKIGRAECRSRLLARTLPVFVDDVLDPTGSAPAGPGTRTDSYHAPRNATEQTLVKIWETVLGLPRVGIHDEFADLGGDSLLSMQVLLAAEDAGLPITTEDIQRYGTIAGLAAAIGPRTEKRSRRAAPQLGAVPLLPRQKSLLRRGEAAGDFTTVTTVLTLKEPMDKPLDGRLLDRALQQLVFHHDALRLRCHHVNGDWVGEYAGHTPPGLVSEVDLSAVPEREQPDRIRAEILRLHQSLDIERGPVIRLGLIRREDAPDLLVLAAHHLVADAYSMVVLARDLDTLYRQLACGESPQLPPPTATVQEWMERAIAFAESEEAVGESAYWSGIVRRRTIFPVDLDKGSHRVGREEMMRTQLGEAATKGLRWLQREGLSIPDLLHTALARALNEEMGERTVQFWTVSHGRGSRLPAVDLSRTVGFLVRGYPVSLTIPETADDLETALAVRAQFQQIPHQGMGYEIVANYSPYKLARQLLGRMVPPVRLNYVGDLDRMYEGLRVFRAAAGSQMPLSGSLPRSDQIPWHQMLDVMAWIDGAALKMMVRYHSGAFRADTVDRFSGRIVDALSRLSVVAPAQEQGAEP
jgi:non-ribosomal peptide synthase protein (TIGR01720 family)